MQTYAKSVGKSITDLVQVVVQHTDSAHISLGDGLLLHPLNKIKHGMVIISFAIVTQQLASSDHQLDLSSYSISFLGR